jgi:hypothetical protein
LKTKITEFYVFIVEGERETVPSLVDSSFGVLHMATDREDQAMGLKPQAAEIAKELKLPVKLVRFTNIEVLEVFGEKH